MIVIVEAVAVSVAVAVVVVHVYSLFYQLICTVCLTIRNHLHKYSHLKIIKTLPYIISVICEIERTRYQ